MYHMLSVLFMMYHMLFVLFMMNFVRKDFDICIPNSPDEVKISVFQLLANACEDMMNVSGLTKYRHCMQFLDRLVYSQILWSKQLVIVT